MNNLDKGSIVHAPVNERAVPLVATELIHAFAHADEQWQQFVA